MCRCALGETCSAYAPGHALHLIQRRLASATPLEWIDGVVAEVSGDGTITVDGIDGTRLEAWGRALAAGALSVGDPVAVHPRYRVVAAGPTWINATVTLID